MKNDERFFRIKYGYAKNEILSIPESKLATAIFAKQTGRMFQFGKAFIDGKEIKTITEDYHHHTGWNDLYEPKDAEDMRQIQRDCPDYTGCIDNATKLAIRAGKENNVDILNEPLMLAIKHA